MATTRNVVIKIAKELQNMRSKIVFYFIFAAV